MSRYRRLIGQGLAKHAVVLLLKVLPWLGASGRLQKGLIMFASIARAIPHDERHRVQLEQLIEAFRNDHPAVKLACRMVTELHPRYLSNFIRDLWIPLWRNGAIRQEFREREGFDPPSLAVISPLQECNLQCEGCYADAKVQRQSRRLDFDAIDRLVTELKSYGTPFIVFTGGEPTHPLIWPTIKSICLKHSDQAFMMYTNGTLIDDAKVADLIEMGNLSPAISLEGWQEETDARRGRGVYDRVMTAMDRLREAGVLFGFSLTYTSKNFEVATSPHFIEHLMEKGCMYGWYFMYVPVGKDPDTDLVVRPWQRDRIRRFTWQILREKGLFIADFWNSGPLASGCIAGGRYLHVNHRGDIEPCVFFKFTTHNIYDCRLIDALRSPLFANIREVQKCQRNPLTPCCFMDHPERGKQAVEDAHAQPSEGCEGLFKPEILSFLKWFSTEYREKYASSAWTESGDYAWFSDAYCGPLWISPAPCAMPRENEGSILEWEETVMTR